MAELFARTVVKDPIILRFKSRLSTFNIYMSYKTKSTQICQLTSHTTFIRRYSQDSHARGG